MTSYSFKDLYSTEFGIDCINALKQSYADINSFSCIGKPKQKNLFVYLNGCDAKYRTKDGEIITAKSGSIVFTPAGSEYSVRFFDTSNGNGYTVGLNLMILDKNSIPAVFSESIAVLSPDNANYKKLFDLLSKYGEANIICHSKMKSLTYEFLFLLSSYYKSSYSRSFKIIKKGIEYLESDGEQTLSISQIAKMCNISESYFRRIFKDYSGQSPVEFRTEARITRAKNYLLSEDLTVSQISDRLGFSDTSYFIETFRRFTGMTPLQYRNKHI